MSNSPGTRKKTPAGFLLAVVGQAGVPIMAGTIVGCILARDVAVDHVVLFATGMALGVVDWFFS